VPTDSVFSFRMNAGISGEVNRSIAGTVITPEPQNASTPVTAYGVVVILDANGARPVTSSDTTASAEGGFSSRPYPSSDLNYGLVNAGAADPGFGGGTPPPLGEISVLRRGFMTVLLGGSTAATKHAPAYVWTAASSGTHVQGQVEVTNPSGNGFALYRTWFRGPADASGNVEIEINL
jgi:hypothetical protein